MTTKKITVTDLLKEKEKYQVKSDLREDVYIERLNGHITIQKPERSLVLEAISMDDDQEQKENADPFFVYNIVVDPNLKDQELLSAYGCVEPLDIVTKLFEPGEIVQIAQIGMGLAGYNGKGVGLVKDLKN